MTANSTRPSVLMAVARRLPALVEQAEHLDTMAQSVREATENGHAEASVSLRAERWAASASSALDAAERLIAAEPAQSLSEAAIQLMLAVSRAQIAYGANELTEEAREAATQLDRLLQSALPVVADAAGIDLSDFARAYYADRRTDPFYRGAGAEDTSATRPMLDEGRLRAAGLL